MDHVTSFSVNYNETHKSPLIHQKYKTQKNQIGTFEVFKGLKNLNLGFSKQFPALLGTNGPWRLLQKSTVLRTYLQCFYNSYAFQKRCTSAGCSISRNPDFVVRRESCTSQVENL